MAKKLVAMMMGALILFYFVFGWLVGFPNEKKRLRAEVSKYIEINYGLTPTDIDVSFSLDGMDSARVLTKEFPFRFDVSVNRKNKTISNDLYLESLTEYCLEKQIEKKKGSSSNDIDIRVELETRFSKTSPKVTPEEIQAEPNRLLNDSTIRYYCAMSGKEMDFQKYYSVFSQVTSFFAPTCIYIYYLNTEGKEKSICIKKEDFPKIHNAEDIASFAK